MCTICDSNYSDCFLQCFTPTDAVAFSTAQFGGGAGPIYLDNVACSGRESNLLDCPRSSFVSCHSRRRGAGVRCQGIELMIIIM